MRVTTSQLYDNLLAGVQKQLSIQSSGNEQITSGTRFQTPAQAALDYRISLDIRHAQMGVTGGLEGTTIVESRLSISQNNLNSMTNNFTRLKTLAVQQASGQLSVADRQAALSEVGHLKTAFLNAANQKWEGQALFAGTAVDKDAFVADPLSPSGYSYNGSTQDRIVTISDTQQIISNVRGDAPAFALAFQTIRDFETALQNNDSAALQNAVGSLTDASNALIDLTADVGARLSALSYTTNAFNDMKTHLDIRLNTHEGVDVAAVVTQLQQSEIALQASYNQISKLQSLSLVNFLR